MAAPTDTSQSIGRQEPKANSLMANSGFLPLLSQCTNHHGGDSNVSSQLVGRPRAKGIHAVVTLQELLSRKSNRLNPLLGLKLPMSISSRHAWLVNVFVCLIIMLGRKLDYISSIGEEAVIWEVEFPLCPTPDRCEYLEKL